ncbi:MAG: hypothetical protein Q9227_008657 [Pyrenula ochraceoflavens]
MKVLQLLPLASLSSSFVLPTAETFRSISVQNKEEPQKPETDLGRKLPCPHKIWKELEDKFENTKNGLQNSLDEAVDYTFETAVKFGNSLEDSFDAESWFESEQDEVDLDNFSFERPHHRPPHHRKPKHPPHHGPPNMTVYQLIASSKYTTKLAELINDYDDLVEALNGTAANYTVFAPTDKAFEKIPDKAPKPSKEFLKRVLSYHVSPDFYPAGRVLVSRTIPTLNVEETLGDKPQRLATQIGLKGLTVNFYSRIVAIDIFGTNGVIHGVDSLIIPPPKAIDIVQLLPGQFSTLELALNKTDLDISDPSTHVGGTLFAPSNFAFQKLGPKINAFLFSKYGLKYLKALLKYHIVNDITLYSDAIYKAETEAQGVPKGQYHIDLPTALEDKTLSVDIARYGRLISIKVNGYTRVSVSDGVAKDGVIQVVSDVLIPPKQPGMADVDVEDMTVEEFKERLDPYTTDIDFRVDL